MNEKQDRGNDERVMIELIFGMGCETWIRFVSVVLVCVVSHVRDSRYYQDLRLESLPKVKILYG